MCLVKMPSAIVGFLVDVLSQQLGIIQVGRVGEEMKDILKSFLLRKRGVNMINAHDQAIVGV